MTLLATLGIVGVLIVIVLYSFLAWNAKRLVTKFKFSDFSFTRIDDQQVNTTSQSILQPSSIDLSIVFPAYLEEKRVIQTLKETLDYLHKRQKKNPSFTFELIVVDDGSKDRTSQVVIDYVKENRLYDVIYLLRYEKNRGKGFAVKQGVIRCRGKQILMADSDAATEISDLESLEKGLQKIEKNGHGIAVGSRAHMEKGVVRERKWYRNVLMYGWHFLVKFIAGVSNIEDTQCGFKLFTRETAKQIFSNAKINGWSFDIDLFIIANTLRIPTIELPVNWTEIEGSKMNLRGMINMGIDLVLLRLYYVLGLWQVDPNATIPK